MKPVDINDFLAQRVIGQEEALRYVSVAIFKHLQGEKYGNLLLIGNSGTGKTTIMRAIEALYSAHEELQEHRVVPMKADWTNRDDRITQFLAEHGRYGIPFYLLYQPGQEPRVFAELLTKDGLVEAVETASSALAQR